MATWRQVEEEAPELGPKVRHRFEATGLAVLATLRADGAPRVSGIEVMFVGHELWIGSMPDARKTLDLRRDGRCALHAATADKEVAAGDAKVSGHAVLVDDDVKAEYLRLSQAEGVAPPPPGPFDLYRLDVTEISFLRPGGDHLVIEWWHPGETPQRVERR